MAGSIKLFQFVQKFHRFIGIYPREPNQKHSTNWTQATCLISYAQYLCTTSAFLLFEANSLFDFGFVFFTLAAVVNCIAIYLIFIWQSQNTYEFIENCERFIEKRVHSTRAEYDKFIEKVELFNKFLCFGLFITISLLLLTVVPYTFAKYYIFDKGEDSFYLFFPVWFPFDWKTPCGYLVAWFTQCAGCIVGVNIDIQFLNLVFGSCWLFIFIAEDITQDVIEFNLFVAEATSNEDRTECTKRFRGMVQVYTDAKQCIVEFNHVFKYSLFTCFLWDMVGGSSLLVTIQFELWTDHSNSLEVALLILLLIWMIAIVFLLCEPGERIINHLVEFSDELNRCDWYLLPIELHRWYIIFLSDTQNPIKVLGYANIVCERETSKKMIKSAFSYFTTFRRFKT